MMKDSVLVVQRRPSTRPIGEWSIDITINNEEAGNFHLKDAGTERQYRQLESYVLESAKYLWYASEYGEAELEKLSVLDNEAKSYANRLWQSLGIETRLEKNPDSTGCEIIVREDEPEKGVNSEETIHYLQWELLEIAELSSALRNRPYSVKVLRQIGFLKSTGVPTDIPGVSYDVLKDVPLPLTKVRQAGRPYKILLVIARKLFPEAKSASRNWIFSEERPDADAHFAQEPLMDIQRRYNNRVWLDVVRPGSLDELRNHLAARSKDGIIFNLVHFDLHGHQKPTEFELRFAVDSGPPPKGQGRSTQPEITGTVVLALRDQRVEHVILNSCWSAWSGNKRHANFCRRLLKEGNYVRSVAAIWASVGEALVNRYLADFYELLLVEQIGFDAAVQEARVRLRDPTRWPDPDHQFFDDFNCIQYTRYSGKVMPAGKEQSNRPHLLEAVVRKARSLFSPRSLTPEGRSKGGASSRSSIRSRSISPRRSTSSRGLPPRDPPLQLKLLYLQLELYLAHSRIVYAFDPTRRVDELVRIVKSLATYWLETNFVRDVFFYNAENFHDPNPPPLPGPYRRNSRGMVSALYIIDRVDAAVDGAGPDWTEAKRVRVLNNLRSKLGKLKKKDNYILLLGFHQEPDWCKEKLDGFGAQLLWHQQVCPWNFANPFFIPRHTNTDVN